MEKKRNVKLTVSTVENDRPPRFSGSFEEAVDMVWKLTREACSLSGRYDAKQRLQRHVVTIYKKTTGRVKDLADAEELEKLL
jgi:hypothetical protein